MNTGYRIKPKAGRDLDDYSDYLVEEASVDVALRFLDAARRTFALLSTQSGMGWRPKLNHPALAGLRVFRVNGFARMLILYRAHSEGVDILRVVHGSRNLQRLVRREGIE